MTENPSFEWIEVTIDCTDVEAVSTFWCRLLGVNRVDDPQPGRDDVVALGSAYENMPQWCAVVGQPCDHHLADTA